MRRAVAFCFIAALVVPFAVGAAESTLDATCVGATGNPSGTALFAESDDKSVMENFLKKRVVCPSACYDIKLVIDTRDKNLRITVSAEDKCGSPKPDISKIKSVFTPLEKPNEKRNCNTGKGLPSVTATTLPLNAGALFFGNMFNYKIPQAFSQPLTVGPKSRCDLDAANAVIGAFTSNGRDGLDKGLQKMATLPNPSVAPAPTENKSAPEVTLAAIPPSETPEQAKPNTEPIKVDDTAGLAQLLQDKYGVPPEQAKSLVESDADKIKAMVEKSLNNDKAGATAIAKELKLNDDVINTIATMEPAKQYTPDEAQAVFDAQDKKRQSTFTEKTEIERAKQAIANIESSGGRYDLLGPVTKNGDRAYGKYQVMGANVGPWTQEALGYRMTPEQFRANPQAQEKVFEHKFQQYADRYGGYENAARVWFGGPGALSNPGARDMLGTSVSGYAQRFSQYFASGEVIGNGNRPTYASAFTGFTGGTNQILGAGGSPFGGANPFNFDQSPYGSYYDTYQSPSAYQGNSSGSGNSLFSIISSYFSPRPKPISQQVYYPSQQARGVVTLIAQPQQAFIGNSIVVSWSSVGMRQDAPCTTVMVTRDATTTIGSSNDGSRILTASRTGIIRFVSYCNAVVGGVVSNATAVAVQ